MSNNNECHLCGSKNVRVELHSIVNSRGTFFVCDVCNESATYCYQCESPMRPEDERFYRDNGWGAPALDEPHCEHCHDAWVDQWLEYVNG